MTHSDQAQCLSLRPGATYAGKQVSSYFEGVSKEAAGAKGICMHILRVPPGGRAKAHLHESHETAIEVLEGRAEMFWGDRLQHQMETVAGVMISIPAGVPHLPVNRVRPEPRR